MLCLRCGPTIDNYIQLHTSKRLVENGTASVRKLNGDALAEYTLALESRGSPLPPTRTLSTLSPLSSLIASSSSSSAAEQQCSGGSGILEGEGELGDQVPNGAHRWIDYLLSYKVLSPTRHRMGHFADVHPCSPILILLQPNLGLILKKLSQTQHANKII